MRHFSISIDISASPERVWAVMRDIEHWHEWTPTVTSIRTLEPGPLAVGVRALVRQPKLPPATWTVTELQDRRGFTWVSRGPGLLVSARHAIEASPGGSRVTLSLEFAGILGGLMGWATRGINARYIGMEAAGLKSRSEGRDPDRP
jgi:hypothetical protein